MVHPNEVRVTESNRDMLFALAESLGDKYVQALKEQIARQEGK
jgi:hypothetical protein